MGKESPTFTFKKQNKEGGDIDMNAQNGGESKKEGIVEKLEQLGVIYQKQYTGLTLLENEYKNASGDIEKKHKLRGEIAKTILQHTDFEKLKKDNKAEYYYSMNLCKWYLTFNIYERETDTRADVKIKEREHPQNESSFKNMIIHIKNRKERDLFKAGKYLEKIDILYPDNQDLELQKIEIEYKKSQNPSKRHTLRKQAAGQIIRSANLIQFFNNKKNAGEQEILLRNWTLLFHVTGNKEEFFVKGKISRNGKADIENSNFEFIITSAIQTK